MVAVTTRAEKPAPMWACGRCGRGSGPHQTRALLLTWDLQRQGFFQLSSVRGGLLAKVLCLQSQSRLTGPERNTQELELIVIGRGSLPASQLLKNHFPGSAPEEFGVSFPDVIPIWSGLLPVEHSESAA